WIAERDDRAGFREAVALIDRNAGVDIESRHVGRKGRSAAAAIENTSAEDLAERVHVSGFQQGTRGSHPFLMHARHAVDKVWAHLLKVLRQGVDALRKRHNTP